jgi:hypothetical protein
MHSNSLDFEEDESYVDLADWCERISRRPGALCAYCTKKNQKLLHTKLLTIIL